MFRDILYLDFPQYVKMYISSPLISDIDTNWFLKGEYNRAL